MPHLVHRRQREHQRVNASNGRLQHEFNAQCLAIELQREEILKATGQEATEAPAKGAGKGARKSVRWSMHEQFEEDLKADLADAQKRDLPTSGLALSTALVNPKLVSGVNAAVNSLLEVISPGSSELVPNAAEGAAKDTNSGGNLLPALADVEANGGVRCG